MEKQKDQPKDDQKAKDHQNKDVQNKDLQSNSIPEQGEKASSESSSSYFHYPIIGEDDKKPDSLDNIDIEKVYKLKDKRSKLQTSTVVNWLKSRGFKHVKKIYLYFPDELIKNLEIRQIFSTFDKDGSNSLDRGELEEMFNKYNFKISKTDLKGLFKIVDDDKDDALNFKEFKKCALNQEANITFTNIMRKLRKKRLDNKISEQDFKYLPMFFESMISFLSYKVNRDETLEGIKEEIPISDKLKKYLGLLELTSRFGKNSVLQKINENNKDAPNVSHLSISSAATPKIARMPSLHQKNSNSPKLKKIPTIDRFEKPVSPPKVEEPTKNFTNYFNSVQNQQKMEGKKANVKEFKKEVKMIIRDAKQKAMRETTDKINKDFRPKNVNFTNLTVARAQLFLNNKDFKFTSSFYKNLMKSKKTEPLQHMSNLSKVIETSFKKENKSVDDLLPKVNFPLPNNLREMDSIIYENYKGGSQKFLTWNASKMKNDVNPAGTRKIKELRKELDDLNEIARKKYGINIPKQEAQPETELKNSFFKLQPELLNSKILNIETNSVEKMEMTSNLSQDRVLGMNENRENVGTIEEREDNSCVPEYLLQNVFLASQEMKNFRIGKPQMPKTRNFKSQVGTRNPYKTKANFASTFTGNFGVN